MNLSRKIMSHLLRHDEWNVGVVSKPITAFLDPKFEPKIRWLPPPRDGFFLADPFVTIDHGKLWLLCEEFDYSLAKGRIVSIDITDNDHPTRPQVSMELPVHIAYPYLMNNDGSILCIPETHQAQEVAIYKAVNFPMEWKKIGVLISDFAAVDSTVFWHDGYWWLTCTQYPDTSSKLYIWYATELLGPWRPHKANPVKDDEHSTRPGGTPFDYKGELFRPAQDNSQTYGGQIVINRITKLTPTEFNEETAVRVRPDSNGPYPNGTHTLSAVGNVTVLDGKRIRFIKSASKLALRRGGAKLGRKLGLEKSNT